jgi:Helix-turn-helix domain
VAHYQQLNLMEREELSRRLAAGHSLLATALALNRAPSTWPRELARDLSGGGRPPAGPALGPLPAEASDTRRPFPRRMIQGRKR